MNYNPIQFMQPLIPPVAPPSEYTSLYTSLASSSQYIKGLYRSHVAPSRE